METRELVESNGLRNFQIQQKTTCRNKHNIYIRGYINAWHVSQTYSNVGPMALKYQDSRLVGFLSTTPN